MNYDQPERQYNTQVAAQSMSGYVAAGIAKLGDAPAKPMPRLDGPACHLEEMTKGLYEYQQRLARVVERLCGPIPEAVDKEGGRIGGTGVVSRYETIADNYATLLRKLGTTVERLESL